jgi:hypothetical protein
VTEPCVGWHADPPCPVYGAMHGCARPDGHPGKNHRCACGQLARNWRVGRIQHGTTTGYRHHRRNGESACAECRAAWSRGKPSGAALRRRRQERAA